MTSCGFLAVLLILNCGGLLGAKVRSSIIGGQDARKGAWPWMVHLSITDGVKKWRCGGSIVASQWVLTAAHCWDRNPEPNLARSGAWIGVHDLHTGGVRYMGIIWAIRHPNYQDVGGRYVHDLAMVKLKKKIEFSNLVAPISLPSAGEAFKPSAECWIVGWGSVRNGVPLPAPEILQQLRIPLVPQSVCEEKYPHVTPEQLCAGDLAGGKDACEGDYGGPLVCRTAAGFVQVGIMSYGSPDGCGLPGRPGVYTRVSSYVDYINYYIHQGEEASSEV